jgi:hypothetical protein
MENEIVEISNRLHMKESEGILGLFEVMEADEALPNSNLLVLLEHY